MVEVYDVVCVHFFLVVITKPYIIAAAMTTKSYVEIPANSISLF